MTLCLYAAGLRAAPRARALFGGGAPLPLFALAVTDAGFSPRTLALPAEKKIKLIVSNRTSGPIEFESFSLHREQIVVAGAKITVFLGPLKPGRYDFFDDFHRDSAGVITVSTSAAAGHP
ncbi:MAG: cupredoxin domain-containing protein [Elusimicrobia bacterium]|nr:cupredoxin domain-containing protein [Elusimicrobiota bacterium]